MTIPPEFRRVNRCASRPSARRPQGCLSMFLITARLYTQLARTGCVTGKEAAVVVVGGKKVSGLLCLFCKMGYRDTATSREFEHTITDSDKFLKAVGAAARDVLGEHTIGTFLFQLIDCSILGYSLLEDALMKLMSSSDAQHLETVAGVLMNKLASSLGFSDWREDGFVIMVRLQRMIS